MITNAQKMGCGGCGCGTFRMYKVGDDLAAECTECKSVSRIAVTQPKIAIEWTEDATGVLAVTPEGK